MEAVDLVYAPAKKFVDDCTRVLKRCTLPNMKTIKKTAIATGVGFAVLGTVGFVFKLISQPINSAILGNMLQH